MVLGQLEQETCHYNMVSADHVFPLSRELLEGQNSRPNNQTCTNCTSNRNHSNLSCFQSSMKVVMNIFLKVLAASKIDFRLVAFLLPRILRGVVEGIVGRHLGGRLSNREEERREIQYSRPREKFKKKGSGQPYNKASAVVVQAREQTPLPSAPLITFLIRGTALGRPQLSIYP